MRNRRSHGNTGGYSARFVRNGPISGGRRLNHTRPNRRADFKKLALDLNFNLLRAVGPLPTLSNSPTHAV